MSDRIREMYEQMAEQAIEDLEARNFEGWNDLPQSAATAWQIRALLESGFTPVYSIDLGGFGWRVPASFEATWLYSDRSTGYYDSSPWVAAKRAAESATYQKIVSQQERV